LRGATVTDADRFKLLFGPYRTPRFAYGADRLCALRGEVILCGLTEAPIPWPVGKKRVGSRGRAIVLFGALVKAVKRESAQAVAYWWGVSAWTVWRWRKALDVRPTNEGTHRLRHDYALEPAGDAARGKAHAKNNDPDRRAKIAATMRSKPRPRPAPVGQAVAEAHKGTSHSAATRAKMSAAHRRRGTRPPKAGRPWTEAEDVLVRELPPAEVVRQTGRTLVAVWSRRRVLHLPDLRFKG
jgi:hypothetical protein